jgi:N-carbamoylputrescine amidase
VDAHAGAIAAVAAHFGRDVDAALTRIASTVHAARLAGARLIVFPESALGGYLLETEPGTPPAPDMLPPALDPCGPEIAGLSRIAGDAVVCVGYTEAGSAGERHASAVCVSGDGVLGRHRKVHLPPAERFAYAAGDGFAAFDTPVGRVGMLLCYDKLFPEAARSLVLDGAEIVTCMAAWPVDRRNPSARVGADRQTRHFDVLDVARAVENQVVWVSSNQTGSWGPLRFLGHAKVVDPDGTVVASTTHRPGMAIGEVDPRAAVEAARFEIDHVGDRIPHAYAPAATVLPLTESMVEPMPLG